MQTKIYLHEKGGKCNTLENVQEKASKIPRNMKKLEFEERPQIGK